MTNNDDNFSKGNATNDNVDKENEVDTAEKDVLIEVNQEYHLTLNGLRREV